MAMHIISGMKCGFYGGNVLALTDDIALLKPTIFPSVPRLFNKIYSKIKDGLAKKEGAIGWLANKAVADKLWYLKNGQGFTHKFYD
jgi:long-chain acyl-CoA synthetase